MNYIANDIIENLTFCVIDLETTGSLPEHDRIIDIGLVKISGFEIISEKSFLIDPKIKIPQFIQKLTKISQNSVKGAPAIEEVIEQVVDFIGDSILVAHNISFDIPFLNGVLTRLEREPLKNKTLCTHIMTKYLIPEIISSNLVYLNKLFKLPDFKPHRALEDARMTSHLLLHYLKFFAKRELSKINHLYYPVNRYEFHKFLFDKDEINKFHNVFHNLTLPCYIILTGENGVIQSVCPIENPKFASDFIQESLKIHDWTKISLQILSNYYEGLCLYKKHVKRVSETEQKRSLHFLYEKWHPELSPSPIQLEYQFDFIVGAHMIPEQFVLNTLHGPTHLKKIIYKYPNHQKKLVSQVKKMGLTFKKKKTPPPKSPDMISQITNSYLHQRKSEYLFFDYNDLTHKIDESWLNIYKILKSQENPAFLEINF